MSRNRDETRMEEKIQTSLSASSRPALNRIAKSSRIGRARHPCDRFIIILIKWHHTQMHKTLRSTVNIPQVATVDRCDLSLEENQ